MTWLDRWVLRLAEIARKDASFRKMSSLEAARFAFAAFQEEWAAKRSQGEEGDLNHVAMAIMSPFVTGTANHAPLCLQLTPELISDFRGAKPPDTRDYESVIKEYQFVYIDLPPKLYFLKSDQTTYVNAIFISDTSDSDEFKGLLYTVMSETGERELELKGEFCLIGAKRDDAPEESPLQIELVNLAILSLLYYKSGEGPQEYLPQLPISKKSTSRSPKKERNKIKTFSLFQVRRLLSPFGRFGRTDQESIPREGWSLEHRVKVRGHFRWQAYGPNHGLRRLQWIAGHERGPETGERKLDLHRLESNRPT